MKEKINLLLVDDHILFRKGLVQLISSSDQVKIAGEASTGKEALELISENTYDVVILDLSMPVMDGLSVLKALREHDNPIPVLILSISDDAEDVISAIMHGANGYILKNEEFEFLLSAILNVFQGGYALSNELLGVVFQAIRYKNTFPVNSLLSEREMDVLINLQKGAKVEEIAQKLFVSENTVKTHLKHIYAKLDVNNRSDAVKKGLVWGILKPSSIR